MEIPTEQPFSTALRKGERTFLQEIVNSAAVVIVSLRGEFQVAHAKGAMRTAAILLSLHHGVSVNEIEDEAERRAKEIYQTGQDWRRELTLFESHMDFNQQ